MKKIKKIILLIILIISSSSIKAQWWLTAGNSVSGTEWLGGDGTSTGPLQFGMQVNQPINFYSSSSGIPNAILTTNGDFNITTSNSGLQINGQYVLWHNGNIFNIFTGVNAGINNTTGTGNTVTGNSALANNTVANCNTANGDSALFTQSLNPGFSYSACNVAIGNEALFSNDPVLIGGILYGGMHNVAVGFQSLFNNTTGSYNTATGDSAGYTNSIGDNNTFNGSSAGFFNDFGVDNTFIGYQSGYYNTGSANTYTGSAAGVNNSAGIENSFYGYSAAVNDQSNYGCFFGSQVGRSHISGDYNVFIGYQAGFMNAKGESNVFVGHSAGGPVSVQLTDCIHDVFVGELTGSNDIHGNHNTAIGDGADINGGLNILTNATAIGTMATVTTSNTLILGGLDNTGLPNIWVGIGLSGDAPQNCLEINADPNSFQYTGVNGSGLKFRQLHGDAASLTSNLGPGVLSLDSHGNVIYVKENSGGIGTCNGIPTTFSATDAGAIDLGNGGNNIIFILKGKDLHHLHYVQALALVIIV